MIYHDLCPLPAPKLVHNNLLIIQYQIHDS